MSKRIESKFVKMLNDGIYIILNVSDQEEALELLKRALKKDWDLPEAFMPTEEDIMYFPEIIHIKKGDYFWWGKAVNCPTCNKKYTYDFVYEGYVFSVQASLVSKFNAKQNEIQNKRRAKRSI